MENARHDPEDTSEDDEDVAVVEENRAARAIGASVVESKGGPEKSYWQELRDREKTEAAAKKRDAERDSWLGHDDEPAIDEMSPAEQQLVEREGVEALRDGEQIDDSEADPAVAAEIAAVEHFRDKIVSEGKSAEAAADETVAELDKLVAAVPVEAVEAEAAPVEQPAAAEYIDTTAVSEGEIRLGSAPETAADEPDEADNTAPPVGGGAGSGRPPGGMFTAGASGPPVRGPNAAPSTRGSERSPDMISTEDAYYYERKALSRGLLTGAIVGYLWGRRKGRLKAEKKFAPIKKKFEKDVKGLQFQLVEKETAVRRAAREQVRLRGVVAAERISNLMPSPERPLAPARTLAPEANQLHGKKLPVEQIGHVLVGAEYGREERRKPAVASASIEKQVETMTRAELLDISEKIAVDGANLRQVYETHLIGERGLRRIVAEHLRGGDVKRVLRHELVEREIDFERDPILRDRARSSLSGGGKSALNNLLRQAGADNLGQSEEDAVLSARADFQEKQAVKQKQQRRLLDVTLGAVITLLVVLIIALLLTHR